MSSPAKQLLEEFVAGRTDARVFVAGVVTAYYRDGVRAGPGWQALLESVEHAAPGLVELRRGSAAPGFAVRLAERPLLPAAESSVRAAAERALREWPAEGRGAPPDAAPAPPATPPAAPPASLAGRAGSGILTRLVARLRRWFSA